MTRERREPTAAMKELLIKTGSPRFEESLAATRELAKALELPLRQGVLSGDIVSGIFEVINLDRGVTAEFPLDFLAPGTEKDFVAYTIPNQGRIPERNIEGDYVQVPVYDIGNSIDWLLKYSRDARWDVVGKAMQVLEAGFTKKINDDGWHTVLSAGVDRNILVFDVDAQPGQFTKRLVSLMVNVMRRNGGGNSASNNRRKLTDMWMSPENMEDIRNWGMDLIDDFTRREIFQSRDGVLRDIFGVSLHDLDELGEGQEYQVFYTNQLSGSLASGDTELVVGMDLSANNSFVMPVRSPVEVFEDPTLHRQRRAGVYAWAELGFAALDNRNIILGSN